MEEEKKRTTDESDNNTLHYVTVSIYDAYNLPLIDAITSMMDLYCEVSFDEEKMFRTHTLYRYRVTEKANFGYIRRYTFKQKEEIPKIIRFAVLDFDMFGPNETIASFEFNLKDESLVNNYSLHKTAKSEETGATLSIGIDYQQATPSELETKCKKCNEAHAKKIASEYSAANELTEWFKANKGLIFSLKSDWENGVPLTSESFADIIPPSYQLTEKNHRRFLSQYNTMHKLFEEGFKAHYDEEFDLLYYDDSTAELGGHNVTGYVLMLWRYVFLHDILLKGQDAEFNIYRSYYFAPSPMKIPMALLALLVQIVLTVGITIHIVDNFEYIYQRDFDIFITICSVLVFGFIALTAESTATAFSKFYEHIYFVYDVPWFFIICDYISNMIMSIFICLISFFFLMQSESYSDLALNAFALTFLIEIDDMINVFESDEDALVIQDLIEFEGSQYKSPKEIHYEAKYFLTVMLSPFAIFSTIWRSVKQFRSIFIRKAHKQH